MADKKPSVGKTKRVSVAAAARQAKADSKQAAGKGQAKKVSPKRVAAKASPKKDAPRKVTAKKVTAKKVTAKKATVKKATPTAGSKPAAKRAEPKAKAASKAKARGARQAPAPTAKKAVARPAARDGLRSAASRPAGARLARPARRKLSARELKTFRSMLISSRLELSQQVAALKQDSLTRADEVNPVEDGTDAYDRQFALSLARTEQESLASIDDAIRRVDDGTYGVCEGCGGLIERPRLEALPFVRNCISCQSEIEKRNGFARRAAGRRLI